MPPPVPAKLPPEVPEPHQLVTAALRAGLKSHRISQVVIAGGATPPPAMADMVGFARLSLILSGEYRVELERHGAPELVSLRPGDVVFTPANCWDKPAWTSPMTMMSFLMGKRQTGISLVEQRTADAPPARAVKTHVDPPAGPEPGILDALAAIARDPESPGREGVVQLLAEALLRCYLTVLETPKARGAGGKADRSFRNLCLYLEENFRLPISRESAAEHFGMTPNHVSRLFHDHGATKFNDYLARVRVERAKILLGHPGMTVSDVGASCGFGDAAYFCRVFKSRTGMTPGTYRLQNLTASDESPPASAAPSH